MKFISLFAGIGGFDLGLERAGMECVAQVEIDPFCLKVLHKHWPDVPKFEDVRNVGRENLPAADLICGGFPCQPHSYAGKRRGAEDDRDLWPEYRRIIDECRPRWVVGENVPGIRTTILDQVLSELEGMDYSVRTLVIPACAFNAPHRRDRVFVLAHAASMLSNGGGDHAGKRMGSRTIPESGDNGRALPVAYATQNGQRPRGARRSTSGSEGEPKQSLFDVSNAEDKGLPQRRDGQQEAESKDRQAQGSRIDGGPNRCNWRSTESGLGGMADGLSPWLDEPDIPRVARGIPNRVQRLKALGNAVVPQVVEFIGRAIMRVEGTMLGPSRDYVGTKCEEVS